MWVILLELRCIAGWLLNIYKKKSLEKLLVITVGKAREGRGKLLVLTRNPADDKKTEKKLNKALRLGCEVILLFSVQGSGHFQGYARFTGTVSRDLYAPELVAQSQNSGSGNQVWPITKFCSVWKTKSLIRHHTRRTKRENSNRPIPFLSIISSVLRANRMSLHIVKTPRG